MEFPWLPVNATLVVWSAEELHLLKGDDAGEAAGNGRVKGKERVQCSSSYGKVITPNQLFKSIINHISVSRDLYAKCVLHHKAWLIFELCFSFLWFNNLCSCFCYCKQPHIYV